MPAFRLHLGIRVLADPFCAIALNGPDSQHWRECDLGFDEAEGSLDKCAQALIAYVRRVGHPWFHEWETPAALAARADSPLNAEAKEALKAAIAGSAAAEDVARSRELLGIS